MADISIDVNTAIKRMVEKGKVEFGINSTLKAMKNGKARLVIITSNCFKEARDDIAHYAKLGEVPVLDYNGTSLQLGEICGKPFVINTLTVLDSGGVNVKELVREEKVESKMVAKND